MNKYPFYADVGYGNCFSTDRILGVIRTGTRASDQLLTYAKRHHHVYDCRSGRPLNSLFILDNGDIVLSHLGLVAARNRLNQPALMEDGLLANPQDEECAFSEVIMPEVPKVFQGRAETGAPNEALDDEPDIFV